MSTDVEIPKKRAPGRPRKPVAATIAEKPAKKLSLDAAMAMWGGVDVIERRLQNPFGIPSDPIRLTGQPCEMEIRWINTDIPNRYHEIINLKKYKPVRLAELADPNEVSDLTESPDGYVTRGERGKELLVKIPKVIYDAVQKRAAEEELRRLKPGRQKRDLIDAVAARSDRAFSGKHGTVSGDEAAGDVARFVGDITVERGHEPDAALE